MLEPIEEMLPFMLSFVPSPKANITMTEETPMIIPNIVRKQRILLLFNALRATVIKFFMFIVFILFLVAGKLKHQRPALCLNCNCLLLHDRLSILYFCLRILQSLGY